MKRKLIMSLTAVVTAAMLFGCSATVQNSEAPEKDAEASETEEEAPGEVSESDSDEEASGETEAGEALEEEKSEGIEYNKSTIIYDTDSKYFSGSTEIISITDNGHEKLKEAVDKWFEKYKSDFEEKSEEYIKEAEDANKEIEADKTENNDDGDYTAYYDISNSVEVTRADEAMFSMCVSEYTFMGGAHGGTYIYGVNFDTKTGDIIENTEFDKSADSVMNYILQSIEESSEETKDSFYPEYEDTIKGIFKNGMKDGAFWFDGRGMTYAFQQYDIAPYAAGIMMFDIPYKDMEDFPEEYVTDGSFYSVNINNDGMIEKIEIDGKEEKVYLETKTDEDNYYSTFDLHIGDKDIKFDEEGYYYCQPTFVHSSVGDYFMLVCMADNDFNRIFLYDGSGDFEHIDDIDGGISQVKDGIVIVSQRHDAFGTWQVYKEYTYGSKGLKTDEKIDMIDNDPSTKASAVGITLLKPLEYSEKSGDYSDTKELKKGSVIYPVSDSGSELGFVTEDGDKGFFEYTYEPGEGGRMVDGVDEYSMFDGMPYAG